jgi:hypothetical protein
VNLGGAAFRRRADVGAQDEARRLLGPFGEDENGDFALEGEGPGGIVVLDDDRKVLGIGPISPRRWLTYWGSK